MCKSEDNIAKQCDDSGNDTIKMEEEEDDDDDDDISLANVYREVQSGFIPIFT